MTSPIIPQTQNESKPPEPQFHLVVNHERLLGLYREPKAAQRLAAKLPPARVIAIPQDADHEQIAAAIGSDRMHRIVRHALGKMAMVAFRDPRAFGMTDWAWQRVREQQQGTV